MLSLFVLGFVFGCKGPAQTENELTPVNKIIESESKIKEDMNGYEVATLGGGCFWCIEVLYQELVGVEKVVSGFAGGTVDNPSYRAVTTGMTGHAEVIQITFDPSKITYDEILTVFWHVHDPTTLNRQGNDVGTHYRSIILYHDDRQRAIAETSLRKTDESGLWDNKIVTEIAPMNKFYTAEDYHQNYYNLNADKNPYCSIVIAPKIAKFRKEFKDRLKPLED